MGKLKKSVISVEIEEGGVSLCMTMYAVMYSLCGHIDRTVRQLCFPNCRLCNFCIPSVYYI